MTATLLPGVIADRWFDRGSEPPDCNSVASAGVFELGRARRGRTRTETIRAAHPGSVHARDVARIFSVADFAVIAASAPDARRGERLLGLRGHGASELEVRLSLRDSRQHLHLLGATGTGKSTLLQNLAAQDLAAGRGFAVLDPKGDLIRELLTRVPRSRLRDVLYIGPEEETRVIGVNPLALGPGDDADLTTENVLAIFKRIYQANWGPRTDDLLKSCLLTLLAAPHPTLAQIPALLTNAELRREFTRRIESNVDLAGFWDAYERLSEARRLDVTAPLLNKVRDFLLRPRLRRLLCQPRSTVDIGALMNSRVVLLADLGVGRWGESASALAGSFLMLRIWQAALGRAAVADDDRRDFQLYVDEFQSFLGIGGPFADALAQARALRVSLTLANQHLGQLPREVRDAVAANARSRVVFRCATQDAAALAAELAPLNAQRLMALAPFEAAVRVANGRGTYTMRTLPPMPAPVGVASPEEVRRASAGRFGRPAAESDAEIRASLGRSDNTTDDLFREPKTA